MPPPTPAVETTRGKAVLDQIVLLNAARGRNDATAVAAKFSSKGEKFEDGTLEPLLAAKPTDPALIPAWEQEVLAEFNGPLTVTAMKVFGNLVLVTGTTTVGANVTLHVVIFQRRAGTFVMVFHSSAPA